MAFATFNHAWSNPTGHIEQAFDIGVNHFFPVINVAFMNGIKAE